MPDGALLYLHALTGLHPGSGAALDVIDLPVQRERHTGWPLIPGSSLKGVLRAATRPGPGDANAEARGDWLRVFGPETENADKHAGAISLTDARILAFPVRSLKGVYAWATCPAVLDRFHQDLRLAGARTDLPDRSEVHNGEVLCAKAPLVIDGSSVMLEEFDFTWRGKAGAWADALAERVTGDAAVSARLRSRLAILSDDDFGHFVQYATEVTARIGLDPKTKTVQGGALFYQEVLPAETLFYAVVLSEGRNANGLAIKRDEALDWLTGRLPEVIQVGADETIGRGYCATHLHRAAREAA